MSGDMGKDVFVLSEPSKGIVENILGPGPLNLSKLYPHRNSYVSSQWIMLTVVFTSTAENISIMHFVQVALILGAILELQFK